MPQKRDIHVLNSLLEACRAINNLQLPTHHSSLCVGVSQQVKEWTRGLITAGI